MPAPPPPPPSAPPPSYTSRVAPPPPPPTSIRSRTGPPPPPPSSSRTQDGPPPLPPSLRTYSGAPPLPPSSGSRAVSPPTVTHAQRFREVDAARIDAANARIIAANARIKEADARIKEANGLSAPPPPPFPAPSPPTTRNGQHIAEILEKMPQLPPPPPVPPSEAHPPNAKAHHTFLFKPPSDMPDSTIESVIVSGTFNDWRRVDKLKNVGPGVWSAKVELKYDWDTRYFLYKFYVSQAWTGSGIPTQQDKWMIDYHEPVMLHEEGTDCNYLDEALVERIGRRETPSTTGFFTFAWPEGNESVQYVSLVLEYHDGSRKEHILSRNSGYWGTRLEVSMPLYKRSMWIKYWYLVDGKRRYNPNERMGKDSKWEDCNQIYPDDLTPETDAEDSKSRKAAPGGHPVHKMKFWAPGDKTAYLITSVDGWKNKHRFEKADETAKNRSVDLRIACPFFTKIFYYLSIDGKRDSYPSRPAVVKDGYLVNYQVFGRPFDTLAVVETPLEDAGETKFGKYTFTWPSPVPQDIWVVGPFNNWKKTDASKLVRADRTGPASVTLKIPITRTKYKYIGGEKAWYVNAMARFEHESQKNTKQWTNYILPEDFEPIDIESQDKSPGPNSEDATSSKCSRCNSDFVLSSRAREALGM